MAVEEIRVTPSDVPDNVAVMSNATAFPADVEEGKYVLLSFSPVKADSRTIVVAMDRAVAGQLSRQLEFALNVRL